MDNPKNSKTPKLLTGYASGGWIWAEGTTVVVDAGQSPGPSGQFQNSLGVHCFCKTLNFIFSSCLIY